MKSDEISMCELHVSFFLFKKDTKKDFFYPQFYVQIICTRTKCTKTAKNLCTVEFCTVCYAKKPTVYCAAVSQKKQCEQHRASDAGERNRLRQG